MCLTWKLHKLNSNWIELECLSGLLLDIASSLFWSRFIRVPSKHGTEIEPSSCINGFRYITIITIWCINYGTINPDCFIFTEEQDLKDSPRVSTDSSPKHTLKITGPTKTTPMWGSSYFTLLCTIDLPKKELFERDITLSWWHNGVQLQNDK